MNVKDNELIDALINRLAIYSDTDEFNNLNNRQVKIETKLDLILESIEVLNKHEIVLEIDRLKQQRKRLKSSLTRCKRKVNLLKLLRNGKVQNSVKSVEFLNRLRVEKTLRLPPNGLACYISAHAVLRYIQRYGCNLPYLVLRDIVKVFSSLVEVELKPEFSLLELLNHNCVSAEFFRSKNKESIFVVVDNVVITTFTDDHNRFKAV